MYLGFTRTSWKNPNQSFKQINPNIDWHGQEQFETQARMVAGVQH